MPHLRVPHDRQRAFIESTAKRKVIRAGRRGGKTVGVAMLDILAFMAGRRVLYATPTSDQLDAWWYEVTEALRDGVDCGALYKNETEHLIEVPHTKNRIRGKTAWNSDTLRGDYADLLTLDEYQLMAEDTWSVVGAPMLLDNNGDAVFIYTPPSARTVGTSKAKDKLHAAKLFKRASADASGRWATFHYSSHDNPHLSREALSEITSDMTRRSYELEIMAIDKEGVPGALWTPEVIDELRVTEMPELVRIAVALDPSATSGSDADEAGIIAAGIDADKHGYILEDVSLRGTPQQWAGAAVALYNKYKANVLVAEVNQGGEMVSLTVGTIKGAPPVKMIHASKGKVARAEPVQALYSPVDLNGKPMPGRVHHVGFFPELEDEMITYVAGNKSPNRLDAMVYAMTELLVTGGDAEAVDDPFSNW